MKKLYDIQSIRERVSEILFDGSLTHEQQMMQLAMTAENTMPYPEGTPDNFEELYDSLQICDLSEGHAPYCPRYILPDYDLLMKKGCSFLRLDPPKDLFEALNTLLIFYRNVPSVTHFPVYMGHIDRLLEPFVTGSETDKEMIAGFLNCCDRTFGSSFCHMNLGPYDTRTGRIIFELLPELNNSIPNMTLCYDPDITPDDFAEKAIECSLKTANPAFAYDPIYRKDFSGHSYGIASCYNGLPYAGGAFTLSRVRLNRIAENSASLKDFMEHQLPYVVSSLCQFMEAKIRFVADEIPFFRTHFLVKEGFIKKDNFVGLFGVVGLHECVEILLRKEGKNYSFGPDEEANQLGVEVMDRLKELVESHESAYSPIWNHHFMLHAQVGAENDDNTSPGARIAIGKEIDLYDHLRQAGLYHPYFTSGVGDIFPFETTAGNNPSAILDVFKGAFKVNMRYISTYYSDSDLIRVTGFLVKKSEVFAHEAGRQVVNETAGGSVDSLRNKGILDRKVRTL